MELVKSGDTNSRLIPWTLFGYNKRVPFCQVEWYSSRHDLSKLVYFVLQAWEFRGMSLMVLKWRYLNFLDTNFFNIVLAGAPVERIHHPIIFNSHQQSYHFRYNTMLVFHRAIKEISLLLKVIKNVGRLKNIFMVRKIWKQVNSPEYWCVSRCSNTLLSRNPKLLKFSK
jgi:hypothetical protein